MKRGPEDGHQGPSWVKQTPLSVEKYSVPLTGIATPIKIWVFGYEIRTFLFSRKGTSIPSRTQDTFSVPKVDLLVSDRHTWSPTKLWHAHQELVLWW
jgi:hypothetical protein